MGVEVDCDAFVGVVRGQDDAVAARGDYKAASSFPDDIYCKGHIFCGARGETAEWKYLSILNDPVPFRLRRILRSVWV